MEPTPHATTTPLEYPPSVLATSNLRCALMATALEHLREADRLVHENGDYGAFYQQLINRLMNVTGARYGAYGVFNDAGALTQFITQGMDEASQQGLPCPRGNGLLGALYHSRELLNVADIAAHPLACGFPAGHPPMRTLLGCPLLVDEVVRGVIYLADKDGGAPFGEWDETILKIYAAEAVHVLLRAELLQKLHERTAQLEIKNRELEAAHGQLLQSEKMACIGQLAAGVAHEINNPVGYVSSNIASLRRYIDSLFSVLAAYEREEVGLSEEGAQRVRKMREVADLAYLKEDVGALISEAEEGVLRVRKIVQDLKDFSHHDEGEWECVDLHKGLEMTLSVVWNEVKYKAEVVREYGALPTVCCLGSQLNQVFMNLLVNAAHAIEAHGRITIRTACEGEWVWVEVEDTGSGIKPENVQRIFEPFFTTKPVGKGTGLGLSVSYGIVQRHGGRFEVDSEIGKGTRFRVWLPVQPAAAEAMTCEISEEGQS